MTKILHALLAVILVSAVAWAVDPVVTLPPVSVQQLLQASPKETAPQGQTSVVTVRGGVVRRFPLLSTAQLVPKASATTLGTVKVGSGLAISADGTLNNTGISGVASFKGRGGAVVPQSGDYSIGQISGAAAVAATGAYGDLSGTPTIPAAQVPSDWDATTGAAQILHKPTIPSQLSQLSQSPSYRTVTDAEKAGWNSNSSPVQSVFGRTGAVVKQAGDYTATDVGADPIGSATSVQGNLDTHTARADNPHSVTKAQVGLPNVDNTSDVNKPISTATQNALNNKVSHDAVFTNVSSGAAKGKTALQPGDVTPASIGAITPSSTDTLTNKTINNLNNYVDADALHVRVYNNSGGTLAAGTAVYATQWNSANSAVEVAKAKADSSSTMPAIGLIESAIADGAVGEARMAGTLNGVNTSAWSDGTGLYVSPTTAGALTTTRPTSATQLVQKIGVSVRQSSTVGVIQVQGAGRSNDTPNTIPNGTVATTQSQGDNSTKLATTAYTDAGLASKLSDAPSDGSSYARQNGAWSVVGSGTISSSTPSTFASGTVLASSGTAVRAANSTDLFAILDPAYTTVTPTGTGNYVMMASTIPSDGCLYSSSGNVLSTGQACGAGSGMVYPADGIARAYNNQWATPYGFVTSLGSPGTNVNIPSEYAVRTAVDAKVGLDGNGRLNIPKASGTPDAVLLSSGNSTDTTGAGFIGPSGTVSTSYYLQLSGTKPTSGQVAVYGASSSATVHGTTSDVVPVTYRYLASGRYTPTVVNSTNVTSTSPDMAHWSRNGNEVTVTGSYSTSVSSSSTNSMVQFSLPVPSTFTAQSDASGLATTWNANVTGEVIAEPSGSTVYVYVNSGVAGAVTVRYMYMYEVK